LAQVSDVNTLLRGGAAKFPTYKVKGTGVMNLFDAQGKMTPEGIELMKKSGLTLPAGQIVLRIGKVDDPNTDKVFFQVIPSKELGVVTQSGDIKEIPTAQLEKLPVVQDVKKPTAPSVPNASTSGKSTAPATPGATTPSKSTTPESGKSEQKPIEPSSQGSQNDLIGKKIDDLKDLKVQDITPEFKSVGYGKNMNVYYKLNLNTKEVYRTDMDGNITAVFKRGSTPPATIQENISMDLIFVNPLLFESMVMDEEESVGNSYVCMGDCKGQTTMSKKFTNTVDSIVSGTFVEPKVNIGSGGDNSKSVKTGWENYPCVTENTAMKQLKRSDGTIAYEDGGNFYFSNGRFKDKKTGTVGNYSCSGSGEIVSDKQSGQDIAKKEEKPKEGLPPAPPKTGDKISVYGKSSMTKVFKNPTDTLPTAFFGVNDVIGYWDGKTTVKGKHDADYYVIKGVRYKPFGDMPYSFEKSFPNDTAYVRTSDSYTKSSSLS
jgi:hypothetical protein